MRIIINREVIMTNEKQTKDKQVQTRYTWAEYEDLKAQAEKEGRNVSNLTHTVMMAYLKQQKSK